jgi:hypothetical protein
MRARSPGALRLQACKPSCKDRGPQNSGLATSSAEQVLGPLPPHVSGRHGREKSVDVLKEARRMTKRHSGRTCATGRRGGGQEREECGQQRGQAVRAVRRDPLLASVCISTRKLLHA